MTRDRRDFFAYVLPATVGMVVAGSFGIVDTFFVGQATGKVGLAATALMWPVGMVLVAFGGLAGTGGGILVTQAKAAGEAAKAQRIFSTTLAIMLGMSGVIMAVAYVAMPAIVRLLGATSELAPLSLAYGRVYACGTLFTLLLELSLDMVRNDGHPRISMGILIAALVVNFVLDWLFIVVLGLGVKGAAWATVISQAVGSIGGIVYFSSSLTALRIRLREILALDFGAIRDILATGLPMFGTVVSLVAMLYMQNAQALRYGGVDALAAYTVVSTVMSVALLLLDGIANGMQALVAQTHGAGEFDRQRRFGRYGCAMASVFGVAMLLAAIAFSGALPRLLGLGCDVVPLARRAILLSSAALLPLGVLHVSRAYWQATERVGAANLLVYGDAFAALPLLLFTLPLLFGLDGVWLAYPASRFLMLVPLVWCWRKG